MGNSQESKNGIMIEVKRVHEEAEMEDTEEITKCLIKNLKEAKQYYRTNI